MVRIECGNLQQSKLTVLAFLHHSPHFTLHFISICYKQIKIPLLNKFFMITHEHSNKLYMSMVARKQMIKDWSTFMHKIIHSFEIDTS